MPEGVPNSILTLPTNLRYLTFPLIHYPRTMTETPSYYSTGTTGLPRILLGANQLRAKCCIRYAQEATPGRKKRGKKAVTHTRAQGLCKSTYQTCFFAPEDNASFHLLDISPQYSLPMLSLSLCMLPSHPRLTVTSFRSEPMLFHLLHRSFQWNAQT